MIILLETSPLRNAHSVRGVGVYTRYLSHELEKLQSPLVNIITSGDSSFEQLNAFMSKNTVDIIHYPYFDLFRQTLPIPIISRLTGRNEQKVVVTIHDVIPLIYPKQYPAGIRGSAGFFFQKQLLHNVSAVITDSQTSKRDIHRFMGYQESSIHVIPLAGNPEINKASSAAVKAVRQQYKLPKTFMLYVGDINYNKNIPQLVQSLRYLDESIHLVCVGVNFTPQAIPEWRAIEHELDNKKNRIHFITNIGKHDSLTLSAIYTAADVYVQPSLYEGFGLPVLEAMACETLVVSSNTPALREIDGPGIEYCDPTALGLAQAAKKILNESEDKKTHRVQRNTQALKKYSWKKTAEKTLDVYLSLS